MARDHVIGMTQELTFFMACAYTAPMRKIHIAPIASALFALLTACVPRAYIYAERDLTFELNKSQPVYVYLPKQDVSVADINVRTLLVHALKQDGFQISDTVGGSSLVMTVGKKDQAIVEESYQVMPETGTTVGAVDGQLFYGTTTSYNMVPYFYNRMESKICLHLFQTIGFVHNERLPVWEGCVSASQNVAQRNMSQIIDALVQQLGKNYNGSYDLKRE